MKDEQLLDYLRLLKNCCVSNKPKGIHYMGVGDFLLQHGKWFKPQNLPREFERGELQACFRNAALEAITRKGLRYIEGYATSIVPLHHAWCADEHDNVIELTWTKPGLSYFGVEFNPKRIFRGAVFADFVVGIYRKPFNEEAELRGCRAAGTLLRQTAGAIPE